MNDFLKARLQELAEANEKKRLLVAELEKSRPERIAAYTAKRTAELIARKEAAAAAQLERIERDEARRAALRAEANERREAARAAKKEEPTP